jgi:uncharacterized membrane protein YoaK (UPF0700 family)
MSQIWIVMALGVVYVALQVAIVKFDRRRPLIVASICVALAEIGLDAANRWWPATMLWGVAVMICGWSLHREREYRSTS